MTKLGNKSREVEARQLLALQKNNATNISAARIVVIPRADRNKFFYLDVPDSQTFLKISTGSSPGATNLVEFNENGETKVTFTDSADSIGAVLSLHGIYSTPGDGDVNGLIRVRSRSDLGNDPIIADVYFTNEDVTDGNELGNISFVLQEGGADVMPLRVLGNDVLIGSGSTLTNTPNCELDVRGVVQIDQGADDGEALAVQSSDVAHGVTDITSTDTYFLVRKADAAAGGANISGLGESTRGIQLIGYVVTGDTSRSTSALGPVILQGRKKSGTGAGALGTNENIAVFYNNSNARALIDAEGDLHLDATSNINAWDDYDDVGLLTGLRASVMDPAAQLAQDAAEWIDYARPVLESTGVVTYNDDGHHFVSMKNLQWLQVDAMRQLHQRNQQLEARLAEMENKIARLTAGDAG